MVADQEDGSSADRVKCAGHRPSGIDPNRWRVSSTGMPRHPGVSAQCVQIIRGDVTALQIFHSSSEYEHFTPEAVVAGTAMRSAVGAELAGRRISRCTQTRPLIAIVSIN